MKILYDFEAFSMQEYGGISRYFYEISNHIANIDGHLVEIFAPLYINKYFRKDDVAHPLGVKIPRFPGSGRLMQFLNKPLLHLRFKLRDRVDIHHQTYYTIFHFQTGSMKRVITIHDMIHELFKDNFSNKDRTSQLKAFAVRNADHIICISNNTRNDLIKLLKVPENKITVIYHGYSLNSTSRTNLEPAPSCKPFLLYVGIRNRYKNFNRLLRAYASSSFLKNEFSIICFGGGTFDKQETALIKSLNLSKNNIIFVTGSDNLLADYYRLAAAFVYPSLYEGFGIPALEAMSFGCPVVCSNTSSLPEIVGDAAEFFNPKDEMEICAAIERVVSSPSRTQLLVQRGYDRINFFSWAKCARETLNVYEKMI